MKNRYTNLLMLGLALFGLATAFADEAIPKYKPQPEPITLLVNYQITGIADPTSGAYIVGGPGFVPPNIFPNGEISDAVLPGRQIAKLEGAKITFSDAADAPIVHFTCLPGSCTMKFKDGSVLVSNAGVDLQGRAINMWGPVFKSPKFDPTNGIYPIRIMGCGGLKEVAGKGHLANMVGSVCFNGVFNFNKFDQSVLTGSSKCTITMHTPMPQPPSQ